MQKVFRKIALVILVLLLIFLSLGLFIPKVTYETMGELEMPKEEVFALYNDMDKIKEWIPEIVEVETLVETPDKIGSEFRMIVENNGQEMEMMERVVDFVPNEKVALSFDAGMMLKKDVFTFEERGNTTLIKGSHEVEGSSYYTKCVFAFFKGPFQKIDQGYLDSFVKWAEEQKDN
jgi:uncharacterized protein YndB with AHSA1/START domain